MSFLTSVEYTRLMGLQCPHCLGQDLMTTPLESDAGVAWREVVCTICQASWGETYGLVGYVKLGNVNQLHSGRQAPYSTPSINK